MKMLRTATENDAEKLLEIYSYYVENTAVSFEYETPSPEEFRQRIRRTLERYPYLVAENGGRIVGYAYAGPFKARRAYDYAVETTVYIAKDMRGKGLGRELYTALENALALQNIINLNACIGYPEENDTYLTRDSAEFHERMGYSLAGKFHKCGYKFGKWYDMIWMEKCISEHPDSPMSVLSFDDIREELAERYGIR